MCKQTCNTQQKLKSLIKYVKELGEGYWEAYLDNEGKYLDNNIDIVEVGSDQSRGETLLEGLGGKDNILVVDNCYTRLRVTVDNNELVDVDILKNIEGVKNVVRLYHGKSVQIIVGQGVETWREGLGVAGGWK